MRRLDRSLCEIERTVRSQDMSAVLHYEELGVNLLVRCDKDSQLTGFVIVIQLLTNLYTTG